MPFQVPEPEELTKLSAGAINGLREVAESELTALRASTTRDTVTDEQLGQIESLVAAIKTFDGELDGRTDRAARFDASEIKPKAEPEAVTASEVTKDAEVTKDVKETTPAPDVAGTTTEVVEATVTASTDAEKAPRRSVGIADVAPHAVDEVKVPDEAYTIIAATSLPTAEHTTVPAGSSVDYSQLGEAFDRMARNHEGRRRTGAKQRQQTPLASIRRDFPVNQIVAATDTPEVAYYKLQAASEAYGRKIGAFEEPQGHVATVGWCAPSPNDYSICSPITADGLFMAPEMVLNRGGLNHTQGLDFGDFFGDDFVLPIPGYNILTEAQVEVPTAKSCVEIPCPTFVDDRLNVAALCLTGSLLQNRGYPEFVRTFVEGAVMAMAHLVNREIINEIVTGSTAIDLSLVDPWQSDGTAWSQVMSLLDFAATDLRYVYRASRTQVVEAVLPYWLKTSLRADYIRRNAAASDDLADAMVDAALRLRGVNAQWVYDWQDAFNPGAIPSTNQLGSLDATTLYNVPQALQVLMYLPGTWVIGRQDVIRLDLVYDSTNLATNNVTQLFSEDGYRPMRMCQHSRVYTLPICASGSTGVQRAVTCTDVSPI